MWIAILVICGNEEVMRQAKGGYPLVQLIISDPATVDARDLLHSFDLTLCMASYDGAAFRIPSPHDSLRRKSGYTPARRDLLTTYLLAEKRLLSIDADLDADSDPLHPERYTKVLRSIPAAMWKSVGMADFNSNNDIYERKGTKKDPSFEERFDFLQKLIMRLKKYDHRGIEFIDAPPAELWNVPYQGVTLRDRAFHSVAGIYRRI